MPVFKRHSPVARLALLPALVLVGAAVAGALACTGSSAQAPKAKVAAAGWSGFGVGNWPGASWRPYSAKSPFNTKIPRKVKVHPNSKQYVQQMLQWGKVSDIKGGFAGTANDYAHPTYWAQPSDPVYRLQPSTNWGDPKIGGHNIRIPRGATPAPGSDGHMTVVQPDGWEYDFWRASKPGPNGGVLNYAGGARTRITGSGVKVGATASDFGNLAGVIRGPELAAGKINHALFLVLKCTSPGTEYGFGTKHRSGDGAFVYPAYGGGSSCGGNIPAVPMGARLQLAMSEKKIKSLKLPAWKRAILRAWARYGAYVGDTGGEGIGLMTESGLTYTAFGRPDPFVEFGKQRTAAGDNQVKANGQFRLFNVADGVDWANKLRFVAPPKH